MCKYIICLFLILAGCNSDDDSSLVTKAQLPPNESTQIAALQAEVSSLQNSIKQIQLIGKPIGQAIAQTDSVRSFRMLGEPTLAPGAVTGQFGPCADMGVLQGRGGSDTGDALDSQFEIFKQCTGYSYSISNLTGLLDIPPYLTWDGPNCTGNAYLEMDIPQNTMNADAVKNGLVFQSPVDSTVYEIPAGEQPQQIMIQSAINTRGGMCGADQELRLVIHAIPNNTSITGVPNSMIPNTWTTVAP